MKLFAAMADSRRSPGNAEWPRVGHAAAIPEAEAPGLARKVERCRALGVPHVLMHGRIFSRYGQVIMPQGAQGVDLTRAECRALLAALGGSLVVWTDRSRPAHEPGEWYWVICRRFTPLEALSSKERKKFRHGLKHCEVRRLSVEELAGAGYLVYQAAWQGYGASPPVSEEAFRQGVLREAAFPDLLHNWGAFVDGRLVAFAQNEIHGDAEAEYSALKLDPAYLHFRPSYALIHTMNEYYLKRMGFQYVNAGARSIAHETNFQAFLIRTFGFEKAYAPLKVHYRWPLGWLVNLAFPIRRLIGKKSRAVGSLLELERCRRASPALRALRP